MLIGWLFAIGAAPWGAASSPAAADKIAEMATLDARLFPDHAWSALELERRAVDVAALAPGAQVRLDPWTGAVRWASVPGGAIFETGLADAGEAARQFLAAEGWRLGYGPAVVADLVTVRSYRNPRTGVTHLVLAQRRRGLPVFQGEVRVQVAEGGRILALSAAAPPGSPTRWKPGREAAEALARLGTWVYPHPVAADGIRSDLREPGATGEERFELTSEQGLAGRARLMLFPVGAETRLGWEVEFWWREAGSLSRWYGVVDADDGSVLYLTEALDWASPAGMVFEFNPEHGPQVLRSWAGDPVASPGTWVDASRRETWGNNIIGVIDWFDTDDATGPRGTGDASLLFSAPFANTWAISGGKQIGDSQAAVINAFHWTNWAHDRLYGLGFDEAAGNFQQDNFGRGGLGGDPVLVQVQDGYRVGMRNSANFGTQLEGGTGFMQLGLFSGLVWRDSAFDADVILHEYVHGLTRRVVAGGQVYGTLDGIQSGAMSEGWSDWFAAAWTDDGVIGDYLTGNQHRGVRRYPISTDRELNPLTYDELCRGPRGCQIHDDGEIWAATLWDLRALLIELYGAAEGRRAAEQIIVDSLWFVPSGPTMLEGRDAVLLADEQAYGGAHRCLIWKAFAGRGMGEGATSVGDAARIASAYDMPCECAVLEPPSWIVSDPGIDEESGGDGDGVVEPGELVLIDPVLRLIGPDQPASCIELRSPDPAWAVVNMAACLPPAACGDSVRLDTALAVEVPPSAQPGERVELELWPSGGGTEPIAVIPIVACPLDYVVSDQIPFAYRDTTGGTLLAMGDDTGEEIDIGFPFVFYGRAQETVTVAANGFLVFGEKPGLHGTNQRIPSRQTPNGIIAVLWDDLNPGAKGQVRYLREGAPGRRILTVEWAGVPRYAQIGDATFQVSLYEESGRIEMRYRDVVFGEFYFDFGRSASVGLEAPDGTEGVEYSFGEPVLRDGLAIRFEPGACQAVPPTGVRWLGSPWNCASMAGLQVAAAALAGTSHLAVEVTSQPQGDAETVLLEEVLLGAGVFTGAVQMVEGALPAPDGLLQVEDGSAAIVRFDEIVPLSATTISHAATATVDCVAAVIGEPAVRPSGRQIEIEWATVEPARTLVRYGTRCDALENEEAVSSFGTSHRAVITGLDPETAYFFQIEAVDMAGNHAFYPPDSCLEAATLRLRKVLVYTEFADPAPRRELDRTLSLLAASANELDVRPIAKFQDLFPSLPGTELLLIPQQSLANVTQMMLLGVNLTNTLDQFIRGGGVLVVMDGLDLWQLLQGAGLMQVTATRAATREWLALADPSESVLAQVPRLYEAPHATRLFKVIDAQALVEGGEGDGWGALWRRRLGTGEIYLVGHNLADDPAPVRELVRGIVLRAPARAVPGAAPEIRFGFAAGGCQRPFPFRVAWAAAAGQGTLTVRARAVGGEYEDVALPEQGSGTGVFAGQIQLVATASTPLGDGRLAISGASTLRFRLGDETLAEMPIDCHAPALLGPPQTLETTFGSFRVRWEADEPADMLIRTGQACGTFTLEDGLPDLVPAGAITVDGLAAQTTYAYQLILTDAAGNQTVAPQPAGTCYTATTRTRTGCAEVGTDSPTTRVASGIGRGNVIQMDLDAVLREVRMPLNLQKTTELRFVLLESCDGGIQYQRAVEVVRTGVGPGARTYSSGPLAERLREGCRYAVMVYWQDSASFEREFPGSYPTLEFGRIIAGATDSTYPGGEPDTGGSAHYRMELCMESAAKSEGLLEFGQSSYACAEDLTLRLRDADLAGAGTAQVEVANVPWDDIETVTLVEVAADSGVFEGQMPLDRVEFWQDTHDENGVLEFINISGEYDSLVYATYADANDGTGRAKLVETLAIVDCLEPQITEVGLELLPGNAIAVVFLTDEAAVGAVDLGSSCASLTRTVVEGELTAEHRVVVTELQPAARYYLRVRAIDSVGNESIDDGGGACYTFVTGQGTTIPVPWRVNDGAGWLWDIDGAGRVGTGTAGAMDRGLAFLADGVAFPARATGLLIATDNSLVLGPVSLGQYQVTRRIHISPDAGWARYLDRIFNAGEARTVGIRVDLVLGGGDDAVIRWSSSGDRRLGADDFWAIFDDRSETEGSPAVLVCWGGEAEARRAPRLNWVAQAGTLRMEYSMPLSRHDYATYIHYAAQAADWRDLLGVAEAMARAEAEFVFGLSDGDMRFLQNRDFRHGEPGIARIPSRTPGCSGELALEVRDGGSIGLGFVTVTVTTGRGDREQLLLPEESPSRGVFRGSIALGTGPVHQASELLEVVDGESITLTYRDPNTGAGRPGDATDQVRVDCDPPGATGSGPDLGDDGREILTWSFDEPARARALLGPACGTWTDVREWTPAQTGLTLAIDPDTSVRAAALELEDRAGNRAVPPCQLVAGTPEPGVVALPVIAVDPLGSDWSIGPGGVIADTSGNGCDDAARLVIEGQEVPLLQTGVWIEPGSRFLLGPLAVRAAPDLEIWRDITLPTTAPVMRYVEWIGNRGPLPQSTEIRLRSDFGADRFFQATAEGGAMGQAAKWLAAQSRIAGGGPAVGWSIQGPGASVAPAAVEEAAPDRLEVAWRCNLAPGARVGILHLFSLGSSLAALQGTLQALTSPGALHEDALTAVDRAELINWQLPPAAGPDMRLERESYGTWDVVRALLAGWPGTAQPRPLTVRGAPPERESIDWRELVPGTLWQAEILLVPAAPGVPAVPGDRRVAVMVGDRLELEQGAPGGGQLQPAQLPILESVPRLLLSAPGGVSRWSFAPVELCILRDTGSPRMDIDPVLGLTTAGGDWAQILHGALVEGVPGAATWRFQPEEGRAVLQLGRLAGPGVAAVGVRVDEGGADWIWDPGFAARRWAVSTGPRVSLVGGESWVPGGAGGLLEIPLGFPLPDPLGSLPAADRVWVRPEGIVGLGGAPPLPGTPGAAPAAAAGRIWIAPWFGAVDIGPLGTVRHGVAGQAPTRQLVIEWSDWAPAGGPEGQSDVQLRLGEDGLVRVHYGRLRPGLGSSPAGMRHWAGFVHAGGVAVPILVPGRGLPGENMVAELVGNFPRAIAFQDDTDVDLLTNAWEADHGIDPGDNGAGSADNGPTGDPDMDTANNLHESRAGTDPRDAGSIFRITAVEHDGRDLTVTWLGVAGRAAWLEASATANEIDPRTAQWRLAWPLPIVAAATGAPQQLVVPWAGPPPGLLRLRQFAP